MKHSLRLKITSIFVGITVVMLVCLWLLNNCFLEDFYCRNKVNIFDENYGKLDQMNLGLEIERRGTPLEIGNKCGNNYDSFNRGKSVCIMYQIEMSDMDRIE